MIQRKTWAAATCWQLLIALQLPRYDWCRMGHRTLKDLENMSEVQVDEKIIPAIADLEVTLVMGSRLRKLIKSRRGAWEVSWYPKRKKTGADEGVPLPSEEPRERTEAQVDERIIPAIADSGVPLSWSADESWSRNYERQRGPHGTKNGGEQWKMFPYHQRS